MKKINVFLLLLGLIALSASPAFSLEPMSAADMDKVCAGGGVTLHLSNIRFYKYQEYLTYHGTDEGYLKISGMLYHDGDTGLGLQDVGGVTFNNTEDFDAIEPVTLDVFNSPDNRPMLALQMPSYGQQLFMESDSLDFAGQDLGPMTLEYPLTSDEPGALKLFATPLDSGIGLQLELQNRIQQLRLDYGPEGGWFSSDAALVLGNLRLADHFTTNLAGSDVPHGTFRIGDLNPLGASSYDPMTINVGSDAEGAFLRMQMPMAGSIRLEEVSIAGTDFGPIRVDGLVAHRMQVDFRAGTN